MSRGNRSCRSIRPVAAIRQTGAMAFGFSLIEVLVALVVTAIGLLGLAGLQARMQLSEMDAYQRAQATLLLQDMADRVAANRNKAADYVTTSKTPAYLGTGHTAASDCYASTMTQAQKDSCEWSKALQGVAETVVSGTDIQKRGAMVGARGCIVDLGSASYLIAVVWQGLTPLSAPPSGIACGSGLYGGSTTPCANDVCRRAVSIVVRIGDIKAL